MRCPVSSLRCPLQASKELELEAHKAVKLEFTSQLGYFFRVTKKVVQSVLQVQVISFLNVVREMLAITQTLYSSGSS